MYFVYILMCSDNKLYIGYTENIEERLKCHKSAQVFSTKGRLPVVLIFYEALHHRMDAKRREKYLKPQQVKELLS